METAVLRLGLAGFNEREQDAIREIAAGFRKARWLFGGTEGADAWLVAGARISSVQGHHVRVLCTDGSGRAAPVVIDATSRPVAFAAPAPLAPKPHRLFELQKPDSLRRVLGDLDLRLHATKVCYWTAAHLLAHHATVGKALFELRAGAELLAVVDMKGDVAISPTATESSFEKAEWKHRARKAVEVPMNFLSFPLAELMWKYTTRTARGLLPERYRDGAIFFRRPPRVNPKLIDDVHLMVSRELALGPASLPELRDRLGVEEPVVARALADLYYVGSITSNPDRAWQGSIRSGLWSSRAAPLEADPHLHMQEGAGRDTPHSTAPLL